MSTNKESIEILHYQSWGDHPSKLSSWALQKNASSILGWNSYALTLLKVIAIIFSVYSQYKYLIIVEQICLVNRQSYRETTNTLNLGHWNCKLTFSWKTKQLSNATHCCGVRSLKAPLNIISVRSSSSALQEKFLDQFSKLCVTSCVNT